MAERNPSPPRLSAEEKELIESDNIGDTVFSKKWVLKTLMKLVEKINREKDESDRGNSPESEGLDEVEHQQENVNLEEEFDSELCELWDMSMNKDVAGFLQDVDATDILLNTILKSRRARLTEICIGILGNMACHDEVCVEMMKNNDLVDIITAFLEDSDTPILVETTRLMHVCVSNADIRQQWIDAIKKCTAIRHFNFILENSLNVDLLSNCSHLVEKILDCCDELTSTWSDIKLVTAVCEAMKQTKFVHIEVAEALLHILQLVSTVEKGVQALVSCTSVIPLLCHFIGECGHDEGGIIVGRELSLMASFSVLNVILVSEPLNVITAMEKDPRIMKILMGLLGYSCKIHRKRSRYSYSEDRQSQPPPVNSSSGDDNSECVNDKQGGAVDNCASGDYEKTNTRSIHPDTRHSSQGSCTSESSTTQIDIHHQYFTVAVDFLKDIISEASVAPKSVSNMIAPHHLMLQKIVHYSKRINSYREMIEDLVEATLSIQELGSLHASLTQDTDHQQK